jgi:hypothetical protein
MKNTVYAIARPIRSIMSSRSRCGSRIISAGKPAVVARSHQRQEQRWDASRRTGSPHPHAFVQAAASTGPRVVTRDADGRQSCPGWRTWSC